MPDFCRRFRIVNLTDGRVTPSCSIESKSALAKTSPTCPATACWRNSRPSAPPRPTPCTARLYWLDTDLPSDAVARIAHDLLSDPIVEQVALAVLQSPEQPLTPRASTPVGPLPEGEGNVHSIEVIRKPGVMDPVLASIDKALRDREIVAKHIATGRKYVFVYGKNPAPDANELLRISRNLLANECIEEIHID